ncbi:acyl-CoA dehydrogenase family protein [Streptosporangium sp. NPDC000396]|uniref:acyl-CoA dehydrogenase family protein n=1 Tax=Streptosporangium sp. NPDC000396 TaxID=3366185 RepID=UPI0036C86C3F
MDFQPTDDHQAIRLAVRDVCARFPGQYWRDLEANGEYPAEFVRVMTELGWLATLIPEEYGGGGRGITEAGIILEEIHQSGGHAGACHAQMYTMGTVLRHGTEEQKKRYLPEIAAGRLRLQAFGVTEPDAGSDTTKITTRAVRDGDHYVINGQKIFTSRIAYSDLMLLLARTTPATEVTRKTDGLSVFLVDLREAGSSVTWQRIPVMSAHHTYQVFIDDLRVPAENLIGGEGRGFHCILDGMNAERVLVASEALGDGRFLVERAVAYASKREVFDRPIGANQGVQFPLAQAHAQLAAASLMRFHAADLFDRGQPCGAEANTAKLLASQASWSAANAAMTAFGGNGFAVEFDVERKFREAKLLEIASVSNNLVLSYLGHRVLGLPRSY